ncbi:CBM1 domain-containing protein [Mycena kentingensis (nom. inval.)]|nr:CBM1 domain-containing protein [Mycena kentingensis (nom. inval.)]
MASLVISLLLAAAASNAQTVPVFGQCGGLQYRGPTTCAAGSFCQWQSDFFSQCAPGTAPPPFGGPINFWFPFGDSYTSTSFNASSVLPNIHNPLGNPPFPGFTGGGGENYVGFDTMTFNGSVLFTYNYAYGGATINASLVKPFEPTVLSLGDQINEFLTGGVASKPATTPWTSDNALFSVWIGVNDMAGSYFQPGDRGANVGARNFLFINVPRVDLSPLVIQQGASAQALLKSTIADFNSRLVTHAASFKAANAGTKTFIWDSNAVFTTILANPTQFGFVDATSFGAPNDFWGNNFHPGRTEASLLFLHLALMVQLAAAAHKIFAQDIAKLMSGTLWF